ncbi:hypothetical protein D3C77_471510 [compost metagenome]
MPAHQHAEGAVNARLQRFHGAIDGTEQDVLAWRATCFDKCLHDTKGHFVIRRPDQINVRIALEQLLRLLVSALLAPTTAHHMTQANLRVFGQGPAHTLLAQIRGRGRLQAGKRQQLHGLLTSLVCVQGYQLLEHLIPGLLIIAHQGAEQWRVLVRIMLNQARLVGAEAVVDQKQLDPTVARKPNYFRGHILLIDQHQIVWTLLTLKHLACLNKG